jgi:hypothetical protein
MNSLARLVWLVVISCTLVLTGCGGKKSAHGKAGEDRKDGASKADHSSPEKVAESFKKAAKDKDWKTVFACSTDESQTMLLGLMMFFAWDGTFGEATEESFNALLKKHGIDPSRNSDAMTRFQASMEKKHGIDPSKKARINEDPTTGIKDKGALFGDLMVFMEKNPSKTKDGKFRKTFPEEFSETYSAVEFSNFKIDGATATTDVIRNGKKMGEPAEFKKIDGKWYWNMDLKPRKVPAFPKKKPE